MVIKRPEMSAEMKSLLTDLQRIDLTSKTESLKKKLPSTLAFDLKSEVESNPRATQNSKDEETILDYAEHFRQQYMFLFRDRQPLFLTAENEAGVKKFVSTTIRPSLASQKELYSWQGCAEFVSDAILPSMLEKTTELPNTLRSPIEILRTQTANCFEASTLLCSLLLGAGYDAFVVSGYATREVCCADETRNKNLPSEDSINNSLPGLDSQWTSQFPDKTRKQNKYIIKPSKDLSSKFDKEMIEKAKRKEREAVEKEEKERLKQQLIDERPPEDELYNSEPL